MAIIRHLTLKRTKPYFSTLKTTKQRSAFGAPLFYFTSVLRPWILSTFILFEVLNHVELLAATET